MTSLLQARKEAQKQWNNRACGELEGDKQELAYYLNVEQNRYSIQPWMHSFFNFHEFKDKKVLEIGIGHGTDLAQFAKAGAKCHGIDITENHLKLTKKNFQLRDFDVDLKVNDATNIEFEDNTFDCVYSFGVLHHIPDFENCVSEIYRVLKPGGTFMCALYNKHSAYHFLQLLLWQGVCFGDLFRLGYDGLLATIETGADGKKIKPYVKLYTKKELESCLKSFNVEEMKVFQLHKYHFLPNIKRLLPKSSIVSNKVESFARESSSQSNLTDALTKRLEKKLGWYIAFKATKPLEINS